MKLLKRFNALSCGSPDFLIRNVRIKPPDVDKMRRATANGYGV